MAPLILEGKTLGEKHRHYNQFLSKVTGSPRKLLRIEYDKPDIDNLFKIDIACYQRDVQYILDVLKCEDMLYVSRAIRKCKWLITDNSYAAIINPEYLHNELFPQMTSKAKCKFILHIRLFLKDEKRVEQFFDFLKTYDLQSALKWLPNCSNLFIESIMKTHATEIPLPLIKRLCEKSITFLDVYCQKNPYYKQIGALQSTTFLLHKDFEKYMSIIEKFLKEGNRVLHLNSKVTKKIMKNCPNIILKNLDLYLNNIDMPTFAKYINKEEIQEFIKSNKDKKEFRRLFGFENLQHFLKQLPANTRFAFVKENFIDRKSNDQTVTICSNAYQWYQLAPFDIAMTDLKKLIQAESDPTERREILNILLICAGSNMQHIQSLINFYRKNHINEPFKFKIQFINSLIRKTKTYEYDENTWLQVKDLFSSMEVYEESNNNVQDCVKAIILYNVLHNEVVPDIIEKKFEFDTFISIQKHLTEDKKKMLFAYLYNHLFYKLNTCDLSNDRGFTEAALVLGNALQLLINWNKDLCDFPNVVNKIRQLMQIRKDRAWLLPLLQYCLSKSVRRIFFQESIFLHPTEETLINVLKHDPHLLDLDNADIQSIYLDDAVILKRLLNKLRIYWTQSIAQQLKTIYFEKLKLKSNYKSAVSGLCILLPLKESQEFVKKYAPSAHKINWSQSDQDLLAIQKNLGKRMHLARPQLPLDVALLYAKGDYLQYVLPSINALLYNISAIRSRVHIEEVLNAPVSLQKHGIRIILTKVSFIEIKKIFGLKWTSTKNKSIRSTLFKQTFKMLCKEKDPIIALDIWELLNSFIDDLTMEEDKSIYVTLSNIDMVPLPIKTSYWIKSYTFLKSLPEKANCSHIYRQVKSKIHEILEFLSVEFAADIFKEFFETDFENKNIEQNVKNLALYLLSTKNREIQRNRYEKVFLPMFENALLTWNERTENNYYSRYKINELVQCLIKQVRFVLRYNMIMPIELFNDILQCLEKAISKSENYITLTKLKLALFYTQIIDSIIEGEKVTLQEDELKEKYVNNSLYPQTIPKFTETLIKYLREDTREMYSSIYLLFSDVVDDILEYFCDTDHSKLQTLQSLVQNDDSIEAQLLVLTLLPRFLYTDEDKVIKIKILNKIGQHPSGEVNMHYWRYRSLDL
ncbi:uncharacterized protein LOC121727650 isoform X3 [Aricia agestis]|nr:uncharacterized protein LOC121727650 isoform X3 [Aricia agestis]